MYRRQNFYSTPLIACIIFYFGIKSSAFQNSLTLKATSWARQSNALGDVRNCKHLGDYVVKTALFSSTSDDEETNYDEEETLLKMHLAIKENVETQYAMDRVSRYCQSFPFAAVLPVQALQYLPTPDGGVDVRFMRKKTQEKRSLDGGLRFFVSAERNGIDIVAKRNSQGQTVSKMFSEKQVMRSFVKRISGAEIEKTSPPPTDLVAVESVFHKWLE